MIRVNPVAAAFVVFNLLGATMFYYLGATFWLVLSSIAVVGNATVIVVEQRWPIRLKLQYLRFKLRLVNREMDDTSSEMVEAWHDNPGSDHWRALDSWLTDLQLERRTLRQRIEDLTYRLGQETY